MPAKRGELLGEASGWQLVGQPGVAGVGVPEQAEDEDGAAEAGPGEVLFEDAGELGDGEDEDDVEEDLDRGDPAGGVAVSRAHGSGG
jgi:hypothetical protein